MEHNAVERNGARSVGNIWFTIAYAEWSSVVWDTDHTPAQLDIGGEVRIFGWNPQEGQPGGFRATTEERRCLLLTQRVG